MYYVLIFNTVINNNYVGAFNMCIIESIMWYVLYYYNMVTIWTIKVEKTRILWYYKWKIFCL